MQWRIYWLVSKRAPNAKSSCIINFTPLWAPSVFINDSICFKGCTRIIPGNHPLQFRLRLWETLQKWVGQENGQDHEFYRHVAPTKCAPSQQFLLPTSKLTGKKERGSSGFCGVPFPPIYMRPKLLVNDPAAWSLSCTNRMKGGRRRRMELNAAEMKQWNWFVWHLAWTNVFVEMKDLISHGMISLITEWGKKYRCLTVVFQWARIRLLSRDINGNGRHESYDPDLLSLEWKMTSRVEWLTGEKVAWDWNRSEIPF